MTIRIKVIILLYIICTLDIVLLIIYLIYYLLGFNMDNEYATDKIYFENNILNNHIKNVFFCMGDFD